MEYSCRCEYKTWNKIIVLQNFRDICNPFKIIYGSLLKRVYSEKKEFAFNGSNFFPCRVDPFPEGASCGGKQTGSHTSCLPCTEMAENLPSLSLKQHIYLKQCTRPVIGLRGRRELVFYVRHMKYF